MKNRIDEIISDFCSESHGSSDYWKDNFYVRGKDDNEFIPFRAVVKKDDSINEIAQLQKEGYVMSSLNYLELKSFDDWTCTIDA